jgi:hypothetical protein
MKDLKLILNFIFISMPLGLSGILLKILGVFIVPIALLFSKDTTLDVKEQYTGWKPMRLPKMFSIWDNLTYGTMGNYGWTKKAYNPWFYKNPTGFLSQWYWLAIRNPANGLNGLEFLRCIQSECEIGYKGKPIIDNGKYGYQFVWAESKAGKTYTGLYLYFPYTKSAKSRCLELRLGFKIIPSEADRTRPVGLTFIINPFKGR